MTAGRLGRKSVVRSYFWTQEGEQRAEREAKGIKESSNGGKKIRRRVNLHEKGQERVEEGERDRQ